MESEQQKLIRQLETKYKNSICKNAVWYFNDEINEENLIPFSNLANSGCKELRRDGSSYCQCEDEEIKVCGRCEKLPPQTKECNIEKQTGGHFYTEGGSKMCCDKTNEVPNTKKDFDNWEKEFDKEFDTHLNDCEVYRVIRLKKFISNLLSSNTERVKKCRNVTSMVK